MSYILSVIGFAAVAMLIHELGHLVAARLCHVPASELGLGMGRKVATFRVAGIKLSFGLIPTGSYVMLDGTVLKQRTVQAQLFVHLGGIILNLVAGLLTYGTTCSWLNLLLAALVGVLIPLTLSITQGILWGFLLHALLYAVAGRAREVTVTLWILAALAGGLLLLGH